MLIRKALRSDCDAMWTIFKDVISDADTYVFHPDMSKERALSYWMGDGVHTYVYTEKSQVLGTFIIRDNQPDLGAHVANASFMVCKTARGKGIGRIMGECALKEAKELGYRAMQFNMVVVTNVQAVELWIKLGFDIIGTLPEVFYDAQRGFVDAHIMHRYL